MDDSINIYRSQTVANGFHLFIAAAKASLYPFLTLYFRYLGLSALQTGIVIGVKASLSMLSAPVWLACASKCHRRRFVLMMSIFVVMFSSLLLSLVPPDNQNKEDFCLPKSLPGGSNDQNGTDTVSDYQRVNTTSTQNIAADLSTRNTTNAPSIAADISIQLSTPPGQQNEVNPKPSPSTIVSSSSTSSTSTQSTSVTALPTATPSSTTVPGEVNELLDVLNTFTEEELQEIGLTKEDLQRLQGYSPDEILAFLNDYVAVSSASPVTTEGGTGNEDTDEDTESTSLTEEERQTLIDAGIPAALIENFDSAKLAEYLQSILESGKTRKRRNALSSGMESLNAKLSKFQQQLAEIENVSFILVLSIVIFGELFSCSIEKMGDRMWFDFIDGIDMLEKYGTQKAWSYLGWFIMPVMVAFFVDNTDCMIFSNMYHFNIHFYVFAGLMGVGFIFSFMFPMLREKKRIQRHTSTLKGLKILCGDIHGFTYSVSIFILGMVSAGIDNFLMWQVQDLGGTEIIMGGAVTLGALTGLILHILTRWIVYKITNAGAVIIALCALTVRLIVYAYLWSPFAVLAIGFLHGFSHTLMLGAIETYPDFKINPFIMDRSAKSTLNCIHMGFAYAFGSVLSGFMYDNLSLQMFYQGAAIASVVWCLVFALVHRCARRSKKVRYARLLQAEEDQVTTDSEDEDDWLQSALKHEK